MNRKPSKLLAIFVGYRWFFIGLLATQFLTVFNHGIINVALPVIQVDFGVSVDLLSWILASSVLIRVAIMPIYGRLGDIVGKKQLYFLGTFIFLCGSILFAIAPTFILLIFASALQGLGSACVPLGEAIIAENFDYEIRGIVLGVWSFVAPLGMIFGSIIGGLLIDRIGWQIIFYGVSIGNIISLFAIWRFIPSIKPRYSDGDFDWIGAVALALFVMFLLLAMTTTSLFPFGSLLNIVFLGVFAASLLVLVMRSRRVPIPFVHPNTLNNMSFIIPSLVICMRMLAIEGTRFLMIIYLADSFHLTPQTIGFFLVGLSLSMMLGIICGGFLADRFISRYLGFIGLCTQATGLIWISMITPAVSILAFLPGMFLSHLGGGIVLIAMTKEAQAALGPERFGMASGLFNMIRFSGAAASTPFIGTLLVYLFRVNSDVSDSAVPYQTVFRILAGIVVLGSVLSVFIPVHVKEELAPEKL